MILPKDVGQGEGAAPGEDLLAGFTVVSLAVNLPGPAAARRMQQLGARVVKVEPPSGDPMASYHRGWYEDLAHGQQVISLNLKDAGDLGQLRDLLAGADLLLTSSRPAALARLGLDPEQVSVDFPRLCYVAIVGYPPPRENEPGHDLTYQAENGLLIPPHLPRTLVADMAGAELAVSQSLALLLSRERRGRGGYAMVPLSAAAEQMAEPLRQGFCAPGGVVGGGLTEYRLYRSADGWLALAALEPHFKARFEQELGISCQQPQQLAARLQEHTSSHWQQWARDLDLPLVVVRE